MWQTDVLSGTRAETYEYLNKKLPNIGDVVRTFDGKTGEVTAVSVLRQKVKLKVAQKTIRMRLKSTR